MSRKHRRTYALLAVSGIAIVLLFLGCIAFAYLLKLDRDRSERLSAQYRQEWIDTQLAELRNGQSDHLYCYDTSDTDGLLKVFQGMPEVLRVGFEMTDVSDDGLKIVAEFPNLREVMLYGGRPNIGDEGLKHLSGHPQLEKLSLVNTEVTDRGLDVLITLPNLRSVVLFREGHRAATLTDKGLLSLQKLNKLEQLTIDGGWASDEAIQELKVKMPDCKISTNSEW